jgi:type I restriction enzyme S subunit
VSELPRGWAWTTLGETVRWGSGGTPRRGVARYYGGSILWAIIGDLNDGLVMTTAGTITDEGLAESSARLVPPGTVLVAMYGSIGKLGIAGIEMATNQAIGFADPRQGLDSRFLFWFLRAERRNLVQAGKGATQKNISQTVLRAWPLPLPPLNEQRRIVAAIEEHLSRLDAADVSLAVALKRLSALQRHARSNAVARGEVRAIGDLLEHIEAGKSFRCHGRRADPGEWGVIKVSAMTWGAFDEEENKAVISEEHVDPRWEIRVGDLLLSRANTTELVGATVLVGSTRPRLLLSDKSMRLHAPDTVNKAWLQIALSSPESRRQMSAVATGTKDSMRNISQEKVKAVRLRVPPLEEQRRIVAEIEERLGAIDALRAAIERAQRKGAALRRLILERAFRGELVPQDPSDEPASALLDRIRADRAATLTRPRRITRASK